MVPTANGLDVRLSGVATIQSYLCAGLVDELHLAIAPILLGTGERLLDGLGDIGDRYQCSQLVSNRGPGPRRRLPSLTNSRL
jgi:dihydrofolate reductase